MTTYAPPHAVTASNLPRGYTSLLGNQDQFCRAFYHANQWEANVRHRLPWIAVATDGQ